MAEAAATGNQQVGTTAVALNRDSARAAESPLANTIAQAQIEALQADPATYGDTAASIGADSPWSRS